MRHKDALNGSLGTLFFAYNNHPGIFRLPAVQAEYISSQQLTDTSLKRPEDFEILTNNCLLGVFHTHCIILDECVRKYCLLTGRPSKCEEDPPFFPIRKFVFELRNSRAHMRARFLKSTWDKGQGGNKMPFRATFRIPIFSYPRGIVYNPHSGETRVLSFQGTPRREVRTTIQFIHKIILLSFHIRQILSFRKAITCDRYLARCKSTWVER